MNFIFGILATFMSDLVNSFNDIVTVQQKKINLSRLAIIKSSYSLSFLITFLLGNATSMSAIIFKDSLGNAGLIFPISSCIVLYGIALFSIKNMIFYSKESEFYKREMKEHHSE